MEDLAQQATAVLRHNDRGRWTRPSPQLYPHQWSWDAAFIAIGWAHLDPARAIHELQSLLAGQWSTGMVPHIVFDPSVAEGAYEPGPSTWSTAGHAPAGMATSGICQPPIHALALERIQAISAARADGSEEQVETALPELYAQLARWHRWLRTARDPSGSGLVTIVHPWESGMDNSPRWDEPMRAVLDQLDDTTAARSRPDLTHVTDPAQRPTEDQYRVFHHLVRKLIEVDYDQSVALSSHPFRVTDVWFSAILARADDALATIASHLGKTTEAEGHQRDAAHTRAALDAAWDPGHAQCGEHDQVAGRMLWHDTLARFAPLVAGCDLDRRALQIDHLLGPSYAGTPGLRWPLPTSTASTDPDFDPRAYWRGPQWPPMTWLLWLSLTEGGQRRSAERLRVAALAHLRQVGCYEYTDPFTGEGLGSQAQSWTAAVALDWLAAGPGPGGEPRRSP